MELAILTVRLQFEHDVVSARQRAKQIAKLLGFDAQMQTRLATAVSEIARNAFSYGGGGRVEFSIEGVTSPQLFQIRVIDSGPGIASLPQILEGSYRSPTGMGLGIVGAQRLMDRFTVDTAPGRGTVVTLSKLLPRNAPLVRQQTLSAIAESLATEKPSGLLDEFRDQNQELLRTLDELRRRQDELVTLNRELEDTNRGVVALYAELDERADHLRRADEVKTRFLSNMSHEFRTPLNSMLALSRLLLERSDGELTDEQDRQVSYIRKAAESLSELVNDLLDLSKAEAGKIVIYPAEFSIENLFGALRGMLRPLLAGTSVNLVFDVPEGMPPVFSDEAKVSQILRNFISNALKFTEAGEVRVTAVYSESIDAVVFTVSDTGIGIAPEDLGSIFQEFTQIDSQLQRKVKGTGLGLPLSKTLTELLQGSIGVESQVGVGSTFWASIPRLYQPGEKPVQVETVRHDPSRKPILLIEDHFETRLIYEKFLRDSMYQIIAARTVREAQGVLERVKPVAIILDILLQGENTWAFLANVKADPATSDIPVIVATSVDDQRKALALGADRYAIKPIAKHTLIGLLNDVSEKHSEKKILVIDDQEISRYLFRQLFAGTSVRFIEARNGPEGLYAAGAERPDLAILDLTMPEMSGYEVLRQLQSNPNTRTIPVIVATSKLLTPEEQRQLLSQVFAIFPKAELGTSASTRKFREAVAAAGLDSIFESEEEGELEDTQA